MVNSTYYLGLRGANTRGFCGPAKYTQQCTRLDSNKSLTVGAVEHFRIMKHFLLHYYILIVWKSLIGWFVQKYVIEIMACDLLNVLTTPWLLNKTLCWSEYGVGVILNHVGCHSYHIIIYKTKITLVTHLVVIEYNLSQIWYAYLKKFLRHSLSNF